MADTKRTVATSESRNGRWWWYAAAAVLFVATLIRAWDLDLKPLHHDEGVNGFFLRQLANDGVYRYDPANYHGPTLPYFALISTRLFGMNTGAVRLVPLLFGLGVVALALLLRKKLGDLGALAAGALLAVSPGMVFHSRYFIHEELLVFFTFALVLAAFAFVERRGEIWLVVAGAAAALMFATKETCVISWAVLAIAAAMMALDRRFVRRRSVPADKRKPWERRKVALASLVAALVAVAISILLYSSFFTHWPGVRGSLQTFAIWAKTGEQAHVHPIYTYVLWLWKTESVVLVLAVAGSLLAVLRGDRFPLFVALWGWGLLAAYSLVPYKTPWLTQNFLLPLALIAGYAIERVARSSAGRTAAIWIGAIAVVVALQQAIVINFQRYDDETVPYVYAPTHRDFLDLVVQIDKLGERSGLGPTIPIAVLYPEYWPLPWYLRDYSRVSFFGSVLPTTDYIVVGSEGLKADVERMLGPRYVRVRTYRQRNGLDAVLYTRREIVECPVNP